MPRPCRFHATFKINSLTLILTLVVSYGVDSGEVHRAPKSAECTINLTAKKELKFFKRF